MQKNDMRIVRKLRNNRALAAKNSQNSQNSQSKFLVEVKNYQYDQK